MSEDRTTIRSPLDAPALMKAAAGPFEPGEVLGGAYEIRAALGEGGMGWVYDARDRLLNRTVAIKVARDLPGAPTLSAEAQALAAVSSPCVVTVHALGRERGVEYLVMERIYGVSLETHLLRRAEQKDPFAIAEAVDLLTRIGDGLAAVHAAGIAHWDIKPANVMLAPRDRVVLVDFGIFVPEAGADSAPLFRGTPAYTAPEMFSGTVQPGDAKLVDVYALGCLAFELLSGDLPYRGEGVLDIWGLHLRAPVPNVRATRPDAPAALAGLISEMMAKDPSDRPQFVEDIVNRLRMLAARKPPAPPRLSVLIVDDDPTMASLLDAIVRDALPEVDVRAARSGEEALRLCRQGAPQLLFLDLHLPGISGIDLCLELRASRVAEGCRIVPVSGGAEEHDRRLLLQLGLTQFIDKGPELAGRVHDIVLETARQLLRAVQ